MFFTCKHINERSDIIVYIYFFNSEKSLKITFQRTIQNVILFNYALHTLKGVVAHNALQHIHLIGLSIKVKRMQLYADVTKSSGFDLLVCIGNMGFNCL